MKKNDTFTIIYFKNRSTKLNHFYLSSIDSKIYSLLSIDSKI